MDPSSSKQCVSLGSEDGLNSLPDELFRDILAVMPMHDAVRTVILYKCRNRMPYSLPRLIFDYNTFPDVERKEIRFLQFVDGVILQYEGSILTTFHVSLPHTCVVHVQVRYSWIRFAIMKKVEELCVSMHTRGPLNLPSCLFASTSLKKLHLELKNRVFKLPEYVNIPNLMDLCLASLCLKDDLEKYFSSFPALEVIELKSCRLYQRALIVCSLKLNSFKLHYCRLFILETFVASAQALKYLEVYSCYGDLCRSHITIQAPKLVRFLYVADLSLKFTFGDMSSVSFARFCLPESNEHTKSTACPLDLILDVPNVASIVLNDWFIEELFPKCDVLFTHLNAISLHCLKDDWLYMLPSKHHVQKIVALLIKFPNLRTLRLTLSDDEHPIYLSCLPDPRTYRITISDALQPNYMSILAKNLKDLGDLEGLKHLEYVEILNFRFRPSDLEIVEFLLNNAKVLVEVKIRAPERSMETRKMKSDKNKILACRKASAKANILFLEDI